MAMNLEVLKFLLEDENSYLIEDLAIENKLNDSASIGIGKFLLANKGDTGLLSKNQIHLYKNCIEPLITKVRCQGILGDMGDDDNGEPISTCDNFIDDDVLHLCYISDEFLCSNCLHDQE